MATDKVRIEIELDDGSVKKGFATIKKEGENAGEDAGKKIGKGVSKGLKSGAKLGFAGLKTAAIGAAAVAGAAVAGVFAAGKFVDAAKVQEDAVNALNSALFASGTFTQAASADFQEFASSLQQTSKFGDEAILQNAALIQSLGGLSQQGLKDATSAALDLSAALRIDLKTASNLVGRAATGDVALFKRYGVTIAKGATDAETFANALAELNGKFGGAAAREIVTFSGATTQLSNTFGDLFEELGFIITRSPEVITVVKLLEQGFKVIGTAVKENAGEIRSFIGSFAKGFSRGIVSFINFGLVITGGFIKIKDTVEDLGEELGVFSSFDKALGNTAKNIGFLKLAFSTTVGSLKTGFQTIITGFLRVVKFSNDALGAIGIDTGFSKQIDDLAKGSTEVLTDFSKENSENIRKLFDPATYEEEALALNESFNTFKEEAQATFTDEETGKSFLAPILDVFSAENVNNTIQNVETLSQGLDKNLTKIGKKVTATAKTASFELQNRLGGAIAKGVANITQSLIAGENVFDNFSKFLLGTFGDLSIQLGTFFIIQGIAVEALKAVSGAGAVVAGIALVALGTFLKSFSGGATGAAAGAGAGIGGGGGGGGFGPAGEGALAGEEDREDPRNNVNLTIQGDVFDSRDTSRRISTLLQEAFDDEDVQINEGAFA